MKSFAHMLSLNCHIWNQRKKLWFSNTSHVDSLDRFIRTVVDKVKTDKCHKKRDIIQKKTS